jgi:uncharacterized protein YcnI
MFRKIISFNTVVLAVVMLVPAIASAHVIVTPNTAGVGQELVFNVSCPNEQQTPITKLTLDMPKGVSEVVPTEKDGWTITTTSNNSTSDPEITTITWTGTTSTIPVGQREDFGFGAQVPGTATTLDWKAYQTYADGTIVHWDQTPNGKSDDSVGEAGPYSVTKVTDDLVASTTPATAKSSSNTLPLIISIVALLVGIYGLLRKKT